MGRRYDEIDDRVRSFLEKQHVFFVATAPLSAEGHINLSPKGLDTFRVVDAHTVAYLDLVGSGAETIAHLKENGRIVLMFCAFDGRPSIMRLHGRGDVIEPDHHEFESLCALFPSFPGVRAVIRVTCTRISDSCGFGVPQMAYVDERPQLPRWCEQKGEEGLRKYQRDNNARSIDGLPGVAPD